MKQSGSRPQSANVEKEKEEVKTIKGNATFS